MRIVWIAFLSRVGKLNLSVSGNVQLAVSPVLVVWLRLLAPTPELSDFIRDIGVEEVTHSGVVTRFVLPELGAVSPEDRRQLLEHVREHWATLKNDGALVDALKEVMIRFSGFESFSVDAW